MTDILGCLCFMIYDFFPRLATWILVTRQRLSLDLYTVAGGARRHVAVAFHHDRIDEMLMQVVNVFEDAILQRGADGYVVKDGEVLNVLAQSYAASVRADGDIELRGHQEHSEHFVDAAQTTAIYLTKFYRAGLQQLFKDDAVLAVLACGDADGCNPARDSRVAEHIVWRGRLFDPVRLEG